jgi:hypothetical protein
MKDSKEKEHRISNLKDMIDNVTDESFEQMEEDSELIDYLNENNADYGDELEINDEFIYRPDDEYDNAINLEDRPINEDFIIKAPKDVDAKKTDESNEFEEDLVGEISENFDNVVHAQIKGRPILAIVSSVLGVLFILISVFIFESRSDRVVDNVVAGESSFIFVIFLILGLFLLIYGIYKLFNFNPFENITSSINDIDNEKKNKKDAKNTPAEEPSQKPLPKSEIPLDKDSYKIGEFDMDDLKTSLKKPTASTKKPQPKENVGDLPHAKEKMALSEEEIEEIEYEQARLESESIDDIFAEVDDIEEVPIFTTDSKEREE